jgi:hypothetical protein
MQSKFETGRVGSWDGIFVREGSDRQGDQIRFEILAKGFRWFDLGVDISTKGY